MYGRFFSIQNQQFLIWSNYHHKPKIGNLHFALMFRQHSLVRTIFGVLHKTEMSFLSAPKVGFELCKVAFLDLTFRSNKTFPQLTMHWTKS